MWWKKSKQQIQTPYLTYNLCKEQVALLLEFPADTTILADGKPLKSMKLMRVLDHDERLFLLEHQNELRMKEFRSTIKPATKKQSCECN